MNHKQIVSLSPDRMRRAKTAMYTPATPADRALVNGSWLPMRSITPGQPVLAVTHFGRHESAVDNILTVKAVEGDVLAHVLITGIQLMHTDQLTGEQIRALGYTDRADFESDWGESMAGHIWYISIQHIDRTDTIEVHQ